MSKDGWGATLVLVACTFGILFVVGGVQGWNKAHSSVALQAAATDGIALLPVGSSDFYVTGMCKRRVHFAFRVSDGAYKSWPAPSQLSMIEASSALAVGAARKINGAPGFAAAAVGGGGIGARYTRYLTGLREAALPETASSIEKSARIAVIVVSAVSGYALGEKLFSAPVACDDKAVETFLEGQGASFIADDVARDLQKFVWDVKNGAVATLAACNTEADSSAPPLVGDMARLQMMSREMAHHVGPAMDCASARRANEIIVGRQYDPGQILFVPRNGIKALPDLLNICVRLSAAGIEGCPYFARKALQLR